MDFYQQLLIKAQDPRYENEYVEVIERGLYNKYYYLNFIIETNINFFYCYRPSSYFS
jgi:hypothetical protein